jgi:hypothetical protein
MEHSPVTKKALFCSGDLDGGFVLNLKGGGVH